AGARGDGGHASLPTLAAQPDADPPVPRVLLTGATGLVGSYAAERLREAGWQVRAIVRDPRGGAWLARRGVELVTGDVLDPASLASAVRGCDGTVHAAATVVSGGGYEAYRRPNVDGTRCVVEAAA